MAGRSNRKKEALEASAAIEVVLKSDMQAEEAALTPEQEKELASCAEPRGSRAEVHRAGLRLW